MTRYTFVAAAWLFVTAPTQSDVAADDQSYHLPLIVRDPRREADGSRGGVVERFTEAVDVLPTLCEVMGMGVPAQVDGLSLTPFLVSHQRNVQQDHSKWKPRVFWESDFRADAAELGLNPYEANLAVMRGERYKLVHFGAAEYPPLLFDLQEQPGHDVGRDVAADPGYAAVLLECMGEMLRWRSRHLEHSLTHLLLGADGAKPGFPTLHEARVARL